MTFVVNGRITLKTIEADRSRTGHLIISDENPTTKKRSSLTVAFSHILWNSQVQDYLETIKGLRKDDVDTIITQVRRFSRTTSFNAHQEDEDECLSHCPLNPRTQIPLNYDSDDSDEDNAGDDMDGNSDTLEQAQAQYNSEGEELEQDQGHVDEHIDYKDGHPRYEYEYDEDEDQVMECVHQLIYSYAMLICF